LPSKAEITAILPKFTGLIDQVPPDYSAVKIDGKRAYALARSRDKAKTEKPVMEKPLLGARQIRIDQLQLLSADTQSAEFEVHCGKGAYIRSLARDIGRALNSAAHVTALERRSVGKFHIGDAISLDFLQEMGQSARASDAILSVMTVLDDIPAVALTDAEAKKLQFGQKLSLDGQRCSRLRAALNQARDREHTDRAVAVFDGRPVALVALKDSVLSPQRVLNL